MKIVFTCLVLLVCGNVTLAQTQSALEQLQETYRQHVAWQNAGELTYNAELKFIAVKNYRIPVATSTHIRAEKKVVKFYMQKSTAVTDVNDPSWRRAEFNIPFQDKKSALAFVRNFNKLVKEQYVF